jgi:hypothetical protein
MQDLRSAAAHAAIVGHGLATLDGSLAGDSSRVLRRRRSTVNGQSTFSAAGNFVTDLLVGPEREHLRLVGKPPGGGLKRAHALTSAYLGPGG